MMRPAGAVAPDEIGQRLGVRDVHAALAGHQELAAGRRHGIENEHFLAVDRNQPSAAIRPAGPPPTMATRAIRRRPALRRKPAGPS
jgi:hypothetical protein